MNTRLFRDSLRAGFILYLFQVSVLASGPFVSFLWWTGFNGSAFLRHPAEVFRACGQVVYNIVYMWTYD